MAQEDLKKAVKVVIDLVEQGEISFADGVQGKDFFDFIPAVLSANAVDWKAAIAQAKARDEASNAELLDFVKTQLDLKNDVAEKKVEAVIALLLALDNAILAFKKVDVAS